MLKTRIYAHHFFASYIIIVNAVLGTLIMLASICLCLEMTWHWWHWWHAVYSCMSADQLSRYELVETCLLVYP